MSEAGGRRNWDRLATLKQEIFDFPRALQETLEKGRREYDELVRHAHWSEGPLHIVSESAGWPVALAGAYAFESLLGWPTMIRPAREFAAYSLSTLKPRSRVLLLPEPEPSPEIVGIARQAKACGAVVMVLADSVSPALAPSCAGWFRVRTNETCRSGIRTLVCEQAAISFLAFVAAQAFLRHRPRFDALREEFEGLAGHVQWMLTQLPDAIRSLAAELQGCEFVYALGTGFYYPTACQWARLLRALARVHAQAISETDAGTASPDALHRDSAVVLLSGSRSKIRKPVRDFLEQFSGARHKIFVITDNQDRDLAGRARMAILLPSLEEMVGSVLASALLTWVAYHLSLERKEERGYQSSRRPARSDTPKGHH